MRELQVHLEEECDSYFTTKIKQQTLKVGKRYTRLPIYEHQREGKQLAVRVQYKLKAPSSIVPVNSQCIHILLWEEIPMVTLGMKSNQFNTVCLFAHLYLYSIFMMNTAVKQGHS